MSQEENRTLISAYVDFVPVVANDASFKFLENETEEVFKDGEENEEQKLPMRRLNTKWISVPELVYEDEENLDDNFVESTGASDDKVGKKRQRKRKEKYDSGLEKKTKKKQDSVPDDLESSTEIKDMWEAITNNKNSKDSDDVVEKRSQKDEDNAEIAKLFQMRKNKSKDKKDKAEIAMQVEEVMANLEIAVEDDVELNRKGNPAINKLIMLPLLNEALSKKPLQPDFLDHGVLNLLKNWLEPLPDGSLPNTNIRTAVLKILTDLCSILEKPPCRREQLIKSGIGKVLMFLSKTDEETIANRRLANDLVNRMGYIIYDKSTRYEYMLSQEEREEHQEMLLRRQMKTALKASETKARDFDIDLYFSETQKSDKETRRVVERANVPTPMSMDFVIRPGPKVDKELEARAKMQINDKGVHEKIIDKLEKAKAHRKRNLQALKISVDGRTERK